MLEKNRSVGVIDNPRDMRSGEALTQRRQNGRLCAISPSALGLIITIRCGGSGNSMVRTTICDSFRSVLLTLRGRIGDNAFFRKRDSSGESFVSITDLLTNGYKQHPTETPTREGGIPRGDPAPVLTRTVRTTLSHCRESSAAMGTSMLTKSSLRYKAEDGSRCCGKASRPTPARGCAPSLRRTD